MSIEAKEDLSNLFDGDHVSLFFVKVVYLKVSCFINSTFNHLPYLDHVEEVQKNEEAGIVRIENSKVLEEVEALDVEKEEV